MIYYLSYVYSTGGVPLSYVVRKDYTVDLSDTKQEEEILHHMIRNELIFDQDSKKVTRLIKELTIRTPEEAWTNQVNFGRVAILKFQEHYYGKSEGERQKNTGKGGAQEIALLP